MEKRCKNCKYSDSSYLGCICNDWRKCLGYSEWKPSDKYLKDARKEIMDIMHDLAKRKFNLEVFEKYDPTKPEYLTVNFVRVRDWKHEVVSTVAFDLANVEINNESLGRLEDHIRGDLADLNGGYYLKNMDVTSWYPNTRVVKTNWDDRESLHKKTLNYLYGDREWVKERMSKSDFVDKVHEYCKKDVEVTKDLYEMHVRGRFTMMTKPEIKKVIFNNPATIVIWKDDTKTVVKTQNGEQFDPEKGLAMAISKKVLGNKGNYFDEFKKWIEWEETVEEPVTINFDGEALKNAVQMASEAIGHAAENIKKMRFE